MLDATIKELLKVLENTSRTLKQEDEVMERQKDFVTTIRVVRA